MNDDGETGQPRGPSPVASIAAHRARRGYPGPPATAHGEPSQADGSDILRRLEHATAGNGVIAHLGEIMARFTADDPATAAFWASLAGHQPRPDDPKPPPPR